MRSPPLALAALALLLVPSPASAERIDGPADGSLETLIERALPIVQTKYLHPGAVDPADMTREGIQALEREAPSIVVTEGGEGRVTIRVGSSERAFHTTDVTSLEDVGERLGEVIEWVDEAHQPDPNREPPDFWVAGLEGALKTIDRHSRVISGNRLSEFNTRYQGPLTGCGARLGGWGGMIRGVRPFADAPAGRVGLKAEDGITHVDGVSTAAMTVNDVVERIRGPEGVPVLLTVRRDGEDGRRAFVLVREKVLVPSVESARMPDDVGWIKIDHFSKKTSFEFQKHVDGLRASGAALRGLIVDLRGNTGGSMIHAARIVNAFIDEGRLLRTEGRDGGKVRGLTHTIDAKKEFKRFDGPVVVLVDGRTASGSEIVAGGLKYTGRGLVLGTQTFGKGTVQKLYKLEAEKSMKLTVARYLLPGDAFINSVGVTPDVVVGEYRLDPDAPHSPDTLREPASLQGRAEGKGGLDAKRNPGAGRAPTAAGVNGRPSLRLVHARVLAEWGSASTPPPPEEESTEATPEAFPGPDEWKLAEDVVQPGERADFVSTEPGDDGDDRFNDLELRLAHEILVGAEQAARRDELVRLAEPLVSRWQGEQSTRLAKAFAARNLRWGVDATGAWMDRAPADEQARQDAMLRPQPELEATLEFAGELAAEEETNARLEVINTTGRRIPHLRGVLQSSSAALDDTTFLIGDLDPGTAAYWTVPITPGSRAASRLDEWRLYLVGDDGPLGGPYRDVVPTRGLPVPRFHVQVGSRAEPQEDGSSLVTASFDVRNDGPGDAGEVRVLFGDPKVADVERVEQFASIDELGTNETKRAELSLRVRNPASHPEQTLRARVLDRRTGTFQIATITLPTRGTMPAGPFLKPADVQLTQPTQEAVSAGRLEGTTPFDVAGEVTAETGLQRVEVFVGRDKLFVAEADPGEERAPQTVRFAATLTLAVGPNRLTIRSTTDQGMESRESIWILGL